MVYAQRLYYVTICFTWINALSLQIFPRFWLDQNFSRLFLLLLSGTRDIPTNSIGKFISNRIHSQPQIFNGIQIPSDFPALFFEIHKSIVRNIQMNSFISLISSHAPRRWRHRHWFLRRLYLNFNCSTALPNILKIGKLIEFFFLNLMK